MAFQLNINLSHDDLLKRLQTYHSERDVWVVQDRTPSRVSSESLVNMFGSLHLLPQLEKLHVDFLGRPLLVPVEALTMVLKNSRKLRKLVLEDVILSGQQEDFLELAEALRLHASLSEIHLHGCRPADRDMTLDPILQALAQIPTLQEVLVRGSSIAGDNLRTIPEETDTDDDDHIDGTISGWSGECLSSLCSSETIRVLTFRDIPDIRDEHVLRMADVLVHNSMLREFTLFSTNLGEMAAKSIGNLLQQNAQITKLEIQLQSGHYARFITEALQYNRSLTRLDLYFDDPVTDAVRHDFVEMLRNNYSLQDLNGSVWKGQSRVNELDFYLRLNRAGRQELLTHRATREMWFQKLLSNQEDLSMLFSLLVMNPQLWMTGVSLRNESIQKP